MPLSLCNPQHEFTVKVDVVSCLSTPQIFDAQGQVITASSVSHTAPNHCMTPAAMRILGSMLSMPASMYPLVPLAL